MFGRATHGAGALIDFTILFDLIFVSQQLEARGLPSMSSVVGELVVADATVVFFVEVRHVRIPCTCREATTEKEHQAAFRTVGVTAVSGNLTSSLDWRLGCFLESIWAPLPLSHRPIPKLTRSPSSALLLSFFFFFRREGSPTKIDYRKKQGYPYCNLSTGGPSSGQVMNF